MNFLKLNYLPWIIIAFLVFVVLGMMLEHRFFKMVKTYWFYRRSPLNYLSSFLFICGMGLLLIALLDPRGPEEKIKTEVPTDRTIILLDTSASMLAEDVRPSRLQKAALMAKHFARKAAGHQMAIVAFAEMQKKIVPFTNDIDLIDARLDSIKNLRNQYGSSALSLAIQESVQYFRETSGETRGNILVLTDGEETAEGIELKVPKDVHVALVGIGTTQGGRIPLDDGRGFRYGHKKDRGQDVITKLNEDFFKKVISDMPSAQYWVASSYNLPSDEILEFFEREKVKGQNQQDMSVRPVLMEWLIVPAIVLMALSQLLKSIKIFSILLLLIWLPLQAKEKEVELSPETVERLEHLKKGELTRLERLKLADDLYQEGLKPEALTLYQENLDNEHVDTSIPPEAYLNFGNALLEKGDTRGGLRAYRELLNSLPENTKKAKELKDTIDKNVVTHFRQVEEKKKQKEKEDKEKEDKEKKEGGQGKETQGGQSGDKQGKSQSGKDDQKPSSDGEDKKDKDKKKDQKDENKDDNGDKDKEDSDKDRDDEGEKPPKAKRKVPAKLKQLMSDDRQLQMKMIENGTRDLNRRKSRTSKDW